MIIIIGLVILVVAVVVGVAGVLSNGGNGHTLTHGFAVFGYHVTGSTGTLFLYGIVVGAIVVLGLSLLLAGARRTSRRGREARHGLKESRRQTAAVSQDRDDLLTEREATRSHAASNRGEDPADGHGPGENGSHRSSRRRVFGRRSTSPEVPDQPVHTANGVPAAGAPADGSGPAD
jgi:hypothetical protein